MRKSRTKSKIGKKMLVLTLCVLAVAAFTACGKKKDDKRQDAADTKNYVYSYEDINIGVDDSEIMNYVYGPDKIYLMLYEWDEETEYSKYSVSMVGYDGSDMGSFRLYEGEEDQNKSLNRMIVDDKGNLYGIEYSYSYSGEEEDYTYTETYNLVSLDETGKQLWSVPLGDWSEEEYYYVQSLFLDAEGNIWLTDAAQMTQFNPQGEIINTIKAPIENPSGEVFLTEDGNFMIGQWDENTGNVSFVEYDVKTGEATPDFKVPGSYYNYTFYSGQKSGYDMLASNSTGLYGFNWGDEEMTLLMDYIASDFEGTGLYNLEVVSETEFIARYNDLDYNYKMAKFAKVPADQIKDKDIMTLACYYMDNDIRRQVLAFNRSHEDVRINVTDYSNMSSEEDWNLGLTQMNNDILAGNIPDILVVNNSIDIDSYASKGLFADLYPLMDADESINKEDYLTNILELGEYEGELVQLIPKFAATTMAIKTKHVNGLTTWTFDDAEKMMADMPEGTLLFAPDMTRMALLNQCMTMAFDQFYDSKSGECHFDSPEFVSFLELMKQYPEEMSEDFYNDEEYWSNYDVQWMNDTTLTNYMWLSFFTSYSNTKQTTFGEDISLIGFPTSTGSGSSAYVDYGFALSSDSDYQQEGWDFISYFISDEYQNNFGDYYFAVKRSALDAQADRAMNPEVETYEDEFGETQVYENTYYVGEEEIVIQPPTQADVDYVMSFLESLNHRQTASEDITAIIQEEAAAFFSDQKTAEAVASNIQSRVQILVNEKR